MEAQKKESPVINGYGEVVYFKDAALQPDTIREYKAVFGITSDEDPKSVNAHLCHVALLLNILETSGVPKEKVKVAVVISEEATNLSLNNECYKKLYGQENPNLDLLKKLSDNGVELYVCAQSLVKFQLSEKDINQYTSFSLSALTDLLILQQQGYILLG